VETNSTRIFSRRVATPGRRAHGFTMTELAITLAITAILTTIAAPSFNEMIAAKKAQMCASDLYVALTKARSEALTLNNNATLQPNAGGWNAGWQILDVNNNVLDNHAAEAAVTIVGPASVAYGASGRLAAGAVAPMFVISTTSGQTVNFQCVSVNLGGRPYMKAAAAC
jgi:type IV fimbrial biogenesis protein FimT